MFFRFIHPINSKSRAKSHYAALSTYSRSDSYRLRKT